MAVQNVPAVPIVPNRLNQQHGAKGWASQILPWCEHKDYRNSRQRSHRPRLTNHADQFDAREFSVLIRSVDRGTRGDTKVAARKDYRCRFIDADGHINDHACGDEIATYMPEGNQMARLVSGVRPSTFSLSQANRRNTGNPTAEDWTNFLDKTGIS
jgi:hypothetical protein